jgi:hypothetical protein
MFVNLFAKEMLTKYSSEILKQRNLLENVYLDENIVLNLVMNE